MGTRFGGPLAVAVLSAVAAIVLIIPDAYGATGHDQTSGWTYETSDANCTEFTDYWNANSWWEADVDSWLAYSIFHEGTLSCWTLWNRPPGELREQMDWANVMPNGSHKVCAITNNIYNNASESGFAAIVYDSVILGYCSASMQVYMATNQWVWNGAWDSGPVDPGANNWSKPMQGGTMNKRVAYGLGAVGVAAVLYPHGGIATPSKAAPPPVPVSNTITIKGLLPNGIWQSVTVTPQVETIHGHPVDVVTPAAFAAAAKAEHVQLPGKQP